MATNTVISLLTTQNSINDMRLKINEIIYDLTDNIPRLSDGLSNIDEGDVLVSDGYSFDTPPKEDLTDGGNF